MPLNVNVSEQELKEVRKVAAYAGKYQRNVPTLYGRALVVSNPIWSENDFSGTSWTCGWHVPTHVQQTESSTWKFNPDGTGVFGCRGLRIPPEISWEWTGSALMVTYSDGRTTEFLITAHTGSFWARGNTYVLIEKNIELSDVGYMQCTRHSLK